MDIQQECKQLFYSITDSILCEMAVRFSERDGKCMAALDAFDPASENFLDADRVKPLLDSTNTEMVEAQFTVAWEFLKTWHTGHEDNEEKLTLHIAILQRFRCHASGNDCFQTCTNIWGINCYVRELFLHAEKCIY